MKTSWFERLVRKISRLCDKYLDRKGYIRWMEDNDSCHPHGYGAWSCGSDCGVCGYKCSRCGRPK